MRKIKLFPAPHLEMRVHVSDEMIKDYRECYQSACKESFEIRDCDKCSWNDVQFSDTCMCQLDEMAQLMEDHND